MKLYYAPGASSLSPHIVLREAERRFDLERVDLKTLRTASGGDFLSINPKGHVPARRLDGPDSDTLTEVPVIVQYLADLVPDSHLAPPAGTFARYHLQEWLAFLASEVDKPFALLSEPSVAAAAAEHLRGAISQRFLYLQRVLEDRAYLMGESFTVADAYLFVTLQWCGLHAIDLGLYPNLDEYEARIVRRPAVLAALSAEGLSEHHRYRRTA